MSDTTTDTKTARSTCACGAEKWTYDLTCADCAADAGETLRSLPPLVAYSAGIEKEPPKP